MTRSNVVKASDEDRFLLTVVYSSSLLPRRGRDGETNLASPRVLEVAARSFLAKGAKTGMWHEDGYDSDAVLAESYLYRSGLGQHLP